MSKVLKELVLADVKTRIGNCQNFVVVDSSKVTALACNNMRNKLREKKITMLGVKNTLAIKALEAVGVKGSMDEMFKGHSVLVWGANDVVQLSKEMSKWSTDLKAALKIKGGVVEGQSVSASEVDAISKGPTREELIGKIVGMLLSPGANLAGSLIGTGGTLAGQIKSIADKEPEAEAAPASA